MSPAPLSRCTPLALAFLLLGATASCRRAESSPLEPTPSVAPSVTAVAEIAPLPSAAPEAPVAAASEGENQGAAVPLMEEDAGAPSSGCPESMVRIGRYCVDRWEAHLVPTGEEGASAPWPHYKRPEKDMSYMAHASSGVFPQAYISRVEASEACVNAGKRLCKRAEWIRACKGVQGLRYPYGNNGRPNRCNTGKIHLLERFFGKSARAWTYESFNDPKLDQAPNFLAKSGQYDTCNSDEGIFDMVGNLHEWVSDMVDDDIEEILERDHVDRKKQPWKVGNGIFMGGFFSTTVEHGPGCMFSTIAHEPKYHDYSTGFRCCMDVPGLAKPARPKGTRSGG
jgi:formylglycine-generating enzyme